MWSRTPSGSRLPSKLPLVMLLSLLSGCQSAVVSDCKLLPLVEYDHDRSLTIARQIQASPPELQRFSLDAVTLRDAVRACRG